MALNGARLTGNLAVGRPLSPSTNQPCSSVNTSCGDNIMNARAYFTSRCACKTLMYYTGCVADRFHLRCEVCGESYPMGARLKTPWYTYCYIKSVNTSHHAEDFEFYATTDRGIVEKRIIRIRHASARRRCAIKKLNFTRHPFENSLEYQDRGQKKPACVHGHRRGGK